MSICEEYVVEVNDEDLQNVLAIADEDGEVSEEARSQYCCVIDSNEVLSVAVWPNKSVIHIC